uniref:Succinate dehydrogenase cytochrome b560 subunit n=1 Tax=Bionectria ochroleuca TaxID=29856 RepID=A0A0B7JYV8_BIOOC
MIAQRVGLAAMRGVAKPNGLFVAQNLPKLALAARLPAQQFRAAATTSKVSLTEGQDILAKQRLARPISPHLGIYKLSQVWFSSSAWTRITGCVLSGTAYAYFATYLVAPLGLLKFTLLAFPFSYHFVNGIRHLVFDIGKGYTKPQIRRAEQFAWSASILAGLFLAFGL